jgi:outer membrane protein assembly factor BamB
VNHRNLHRALATCGALVLLCCLLTNPSFLNYRRDYYEVVPQPPIAPAAVFQNLQSSCEPVAQYRHDMKRTGVSPNARPRALVEIVKKVAPLNVDIHGASKSSPTVDKTGVYVGSDTGWFFKMDHDGETLWTFYVPGSNNGIHGSAAVDDKKVYIGTYNGFMYALNKMTGDLVWANPVGDFIGASPLLADQALFIAAETGHPDGLVAKLDCNSGETLWVSEWLGGHSHSSPAYDAVNDVVMAGANSGRFFVLDSDTGETRWKKQLRGPIKGTPMIWDGTVYFSSWDKHYHAYDIKTGEERWSTFMGGRIQSSLTLVPGINIGLTNTKVGDITALNLTDGEILWRLRHGDRNHMFSLLVTQDPKRPGEYLAWSRCKRFQLCTLDAKTGKLLHNLDLPGSFTSVPFAWEDRVYISLDKNQGMIILK